MKRRERFIFWFILGAYLVDVLFDLMPKDGPKKDFFPFFHGTEKWDGKMNLHNYVYGYCGHVSTSMRIFAASFHPNRALLVGLMWLEIGDLISYALNYNYTIFVLFGHSFEYNHFQFIIAFILLKKYGSTE